MKPEPPNTVMTPAAMMPLQEPAAEPENLRRPADISRFGAFATAKCRLTLVGR
jgi:hypothetical protein